MPLPICFVLMPFGQKADAQGFVIDFDAIYREIIRPAIEAAELEPIRADEELTGGIIHKPMFERLILCPFAVADLTLANANVYYELGVRHAVRPYSTLSVFAEGTRLPFDANMIRSIPYFLQPDGAPSNVNASRERIATALQAAKAGTDDSPVFQLVDLPWRGQLDALAHEKTDVFRDCFRYSQERKEQLARARVTGLEEIRRVELDIKNAVGSFENEEVGVVLDLFLSYRAVKGWGDMIRMFDLMSRPVAATVMVREQLALALNRQAGECAARKDLEAARILRERAVTVLNEIISQRGANSETNGVLGRIYKDCWEEARNSANAATARGFLKKAADTYLKGFESDWRDAYPGINAVTLMELQDPPDDRRTQLIPMVSYAVERKIAAKQPDFWDYATRLELAVLANDREKAESALGDALANQREVWEPETTARNLRLISEARAKRGEEVFWLVEIVNELAKAAAKK
jgi:MAP3K TRAFs-binding domain